MNIENTIKLFCDNAVELTLSLNGQFLRQFKNNSDEKRFNKTVLDKLDFNKVDIHRSIISSNGDVMFVLDIDYHANTVDSALKKSLGDARKIESYFPGMFMWMYTGGGIHGISNITYNKDNEVRIKRYGFIFDFYKALIDFINKSTHLKLEKTYIHYRGLTRSLGSYHSKSGLHSIPIRLDWTAEKILDFSKSGFIFDGWTIPELNVAELIKVVPVVNYHFKSSSTYDRTTKVEVEYDKYPPCVKKLFNKKLKGNLERFEILRYLFSVHTRSSVYNFIKMIFTPEEYSKARSEGQINYVQNRQYPSPTCDRMMEDGLCTHCGRASPSIIRDAELDKKGSHDE